MAAASVWLLVTLTILTSSASASASAVAGEGEPTPKPWPEQFHSVLVMNYSGQVEIIDLWYDWPKGRNFNIIHRQLGKVVYDLEWNNGTSFFYTLADDDKECKTLDVGVGILTPNWLAGANYLGQKEFAGFLCNVWEKVEFIWYYEDVVTRRPVHWRFYTGRSAHVMTFEVGAVLDDSEWQAPVYCFERTADRNARPVADSVRVPVGGFKGAITGSIAFEASDVSDRLLRSMLHRNFIDGEIRQTS